MHRVQERLAVVVDRAHRHRAAGGHSRCERRRGQLRSRTPPPPARPTAPTARPRSDRGARRASSGRRDAAAAGSDGRRRGHEHRSGDAPAPRGPRTRAPRRAAKRRGRPGAPTLGAGRVLDLHLANPARSLRTSSAVLTASSSVSMTSPAPTPRALRRPSIPTTTGTRWFSATTTPATGTSDASRTRTVTVWSGRAWAQPPPTRRRRRSARRTRPAAAPHRDHARDRRKRRRMGASATSARRGPRRRGATRRRSAP